MQHKRPGFFRHFQTQHSNVGMCEDFVDSVAAVHPDSKLRFTSAGRWPSFMEISMHLKETSMQHCTRQQWRTMLVTAT